MPEKVAYLTIDDAPTDEFKSKVDFLMSQKIPAIFFCRGSRLEKRKKDAVYAIKKGFIIGNHTYNHPHCSQLSKEEVFQEIEKTDKLIERVYKMSGKKRPLKIFRFSYGDKGFGNEFETDKHNKHSKAIQSFLKKMGYTQPKFPGVIYKFYKTAVQLKKDADVVWTYDTHDWRLYRGLDRMNDIFKRMDRSPWLKTKNTNNIILMHDFPDTFGLFKQVIGRLLQKGLKFKMPEVKI